MRVDGDTTVALTIKQLVASVVTLIAGGAAVLALVLTLTLSGVREDVSKIREAVQTSERESASRANATEGKLGDQIALLRTDVALLVGKLDTTNKWLEMTNKSIDGLAAGLVQTQKQMADFQKQVSARQVNLSDPALSKAIANSLKDAGIDDPKVIILPLQDAIKTPQR